MLIPQWFVIILFGWAKGQDLHSGKLETNNLLGELE
jgi:hypothetical protein